MHWIITIKKDFSICQNNQDLDCSCYRNLFRNLRGQTNKVVLGQAQSKIKELTDESLLYYYSDLFHCLFPTGFKVSKIV